METIGGALMLVGAALSLILACGLVTALVGWHLFYYWLRVKKPIQATLAAVVAAMWILGAAFGVA